MEFKIFWWIIKKILFRFEPEMAHDIALRVIQKFPNLSNFFLQKSPNMNFNFLNKKLHSPIGMAAGLDKNADCLDFWEKLGFGFIEIGTVTQTPQFGNLEPRMFRYPERKSLGNSMGFPNIGCSQMRLKLNNYKRFDRWPKIPVGINIGKSQSTSLKRAHIDYGISTKYLIEFADYIVINISSPNTKGLRRLSEKEYIGRIINSVLRYSKGKPVYLKISPDMNQYELFTLVNFAISEGCNGFISTNTTKYNNMGVSGSFLWNKSYKNTKMICEEFGHRTSIIACGGIDSSRKVKKLINIGCDAVQLYTGLIYEGPNLIHKINKEIYNEWFNEKNRR